MLLAKKCHFFLYSDWMKIRLEIMLSDYEEKKEIFCRLYNNIIVESAKNRIFSKGLTHAFGKKIPIIWFI